MTQAQVRQVGVLLVVAVACMLAFTELDRLVGELGSGALRISDITGLGALSSTGEWAEWSVTGPDDGAPSPNPAAFLGVYLFVDAIYMIAYGRILWLLAIAVTRPPSPGPKPDTGRSLHLVYRRRLHLVIGLLILVDVAEDVLLGVIALVILHSGDLGALAAWQAWLSTGKWAATLIVIVLFARTPSFLPTVGSMLARLFRALYVQRLATFVVLVLAILSLVALHPLLEQVPDIQRSWLDDGNEAQGFWAAGVLAVLAVTFFVVGRKRAELYQQIWVDGKGSHNIPRTYPTPEDTPLRRPAGWHYVIWLLIPAIVGAAGAIAGTQGTNIVDADPFRAFLLVFAAVLLLSGAAELWFWLQWRRDVLGRKKRMKPDSTAREHGQLYVLDVVRVGDVLCALIIALPALGFARSLATEVLLGATATGLTGVADFTDGIPVIAGVGWALLAVGIASAVVWLALRLTMQPSTQLPDTGVRRLIDPRVPTFGGVATWIVIGSATLLIALFLFFVGFYPTSTGALLGPVAITIGSIGAWTTLIAIATLVLRQRRPLALFEWIGLRSDPLIVLFLVVPIVVAQLAPTPQLHAVDQSASSSPVRQDLPNAFTSWLDRSGGCSVQVPGEHGEAQRIRPLVLVAAEGGGIRAAVWTAAGLSQLVEAGSCASNSVFLSSGVSGGSIGLAIAANPSWNPDDLVGATPSEAAAMAKSMRNDVLELSRSTALATAMSGFLVTDPIAATTGLRLPNAESGGAWRDRASLIENSWRSAAPGLDAPYDADVTAPTGAVVLNSTDLGSGCRAVVSQIELAPGLYGTTIPGTVFDDQDESIESLLPGATPVQRRIAECDFGVSEPPLTLDLLDYFQCRQQVDEEFTACQQKCPQANMDWATAGLLSARFPYVTPSGSLGGTKSSCYVPRLQLVDGGYAENSGIGLLADTAPRIANLVRDYNTNRRQPDEPLVVPYVLYLQNSPTILPGYATGSSTPELVVPLAGSGTKKTEVAPAAWLQRTLLSYLSLCNPGGGIAPLDAKETECAHDSSLIATSELNENRRAIVVSMPATPSIALPLGWGLSQASFDQMVDEAGLAADPLASDDAFLPTRSLGSFLNLYAGQRDPVIDPAR